MRETLDDDEQRCHDSRAHYAVIGGTGQQGGATARALLLAGARVRVLVRQPTSGKAEDLAHLGAELVTADLDDPDSIRNGFAGTTAVFAMTSPTRENWTDGEVAHGKTIADAARDAQVQHLVYTSVAGAERHTGIPHFESKRRVEEYIDALGLQRTFVRPVFFMDNFNRAAPVIKDGKRILQLPLPPDVSLQLIAVDDIGAVCAAALMDPDRIVVGAIEIAGDKRTVTEIADILGSVADLPAGYEQLPLSSLDKDPDRQAMFTWYAQPTSTEADIVETRTLAPNLADLTTWSRKNRRVA